MNMKKILLLLIFFNAALIAQPDSGFIKGVDISFIPQIEDLGGVYYVVGNQTDPVEIFKANRVNYVRLRLWHSPANGYCSLPMILGMASRIKQNELKFLLDIQYSDTWADPGRQTKPVAWNSLAFDNLKDSVYAYTRDVITALKNQNTLPDMVQIGNEIIGGMLWPDGKLYDLPNPDEQLRKFAELIKEGLRGVDDASDSIQIKTIIHIPILNGNVNDVTYFYDRLSSQNVAFDIIGLSYYPWWHGNLTQLKNTLDIVSNRYNKEIVIAETAYPWTLNWNDNTNNIIGTSSQLHSGYPASVEGQYSFLYDLIQIIKEVPNGKGIGLFYWAPEWISFPSLGSSWENVTLFDFQANALNSMRVFNEATNVENEASPVPDFILHQNYPNPFNSTTILSFVISHSSFVTLKIYDVLGNEVATLVNEEKPPGAYKVEFNAQQTIDNKQLSSGVYLYRLQAEYSETSSGQGSGQGFTITKKLILLK